MSEAVPTQRTQAGAARGRSVRDVLPRKELHRLPDRPADFDLVDLFRRQEARRVPGLLGLRHERMAADAFAFLRGSAALMALDLSLGPTTGLEVQLCGDAHLSNFGIFSSPERRLVFDVNDFDETLPGPFELDVKRLGASLAVLLDSQGFGEADIVEAVTHCAARYRTTMRELAGWKDLEVWYLKLDVEAALGELRGLFADEKGSPVDDIIARARRSSSQRAYEKLAGFVDGRLRFLPDPPVIVPFDELVSQGPFESTEEALRESLAAYRSSLSDDRAQLLDGFHPIDMARKVVGVGSVGTRCFVVLLLGRDLADPLVLQVKEAERSVLEEHFGASRYPTSGQRVVEGQRMMQTTPDIFLGHHRVELADEQPHDFYFRQFHDAKASADLSKVRSEKAMHAYAGVCAWTLARAHARSGDRAAIAAYLGGGESFEKAIAGWSLAYVERNRADHASFLEAMADGRLASGA